MSTFFSRFFECVHRVYARMYHNDYQDWLDNPDPRERRFIG